MSDSNKFTDIISIMEAIAILVTRLLYKVTRQQVHTQYRLKYELIFKQRITTLLYLYPYACSRGNSVDFYLTLFGMFP